MESLWPVIIVFTPLVGGVLIFVIGKSPLKIKEWLCLTCSLLPLIILLLLLSYPLKNIYLETHIIHITPDIWLRFKADQLAFIFGGTAAAIWTMASLFSWGYMKEGKHLIRYYGFLLLNLSWTLGVAMAGNLITLYVFYELLSISSYPLIAHEETKEALAAALKYLIYVIVGGIFIFLGIVLTYYLSGTQVFSEHGILSLSIGKTMLTVIFITYMVGFGVKAAIMPLHGWVPDAHPAAPAPASALLSGILVAAGAFGIIRVFYYVFGISLIRDLQLNIPLAYLACITILVSSILAMTQDNLKRRLAYSTIGQMSYVLLGISLITPGGFLGGVIHIANHAFMKSTLFFTAGVLIKAAKKRNISEMNGIGYTYPLTMGAFTLASLGLIGTPPLAGFVSKWFLGIGTLQASRPLYLIVILAGSLLCAGYLLPVVYTAFFKKGEDEMIPWEKEKEPEQRKFELEIQRVSIFMIIPIVLGVMGVVLLGILAAVKYFPVSLAKLAYKNLARGFK